MAPEDIALALMFCLGVLGLAALTHILEEWFGYGGGGR